MADSEHRLTRAVHPNMLRGLRAGWAARWPQRTLAERFWPKVDKPSAAACWEWQGALNSSGYGSFKNEHNRVTASHRAAYQLHHGVTLTADQHVLHKCDNRPCCNPSHLFLGDNAANVADRAAKGRSARPHAKLNWANVRAIRLLIAEGFNNTVIAKAFGVADNTISGIRTGKSWRDPACVGV